ncbi:MAG: SDR family NAD(P)-dependent oxidoreductase, partial [Rhodospirillales bacterium]|nr:SDR family NAD(P)-dependent oxidoreductase [Rhodospirillales bacterium]
MSLPKTPSFRVDGRKALVTGAGRGIGRASAVALADAGADVVLAARTGAEVDALADEIRATGGQASGLALDVSDLEATRAAVSEHGPFQILVNNAGTNRPAFLQDITEDDYDLVT